MPAPEIQGFFQQFTFDTLLALISCIAAVAALFVGSVAHRKIKISFREKKNFEDDSQDNSQNAGRDIINNNGINDTQLATITSALASISKENFSSALEKAQSTFQKQAEENLHHIISEADRIVKESKLQLGKYDKIDWINIYFESAKNTADPYMQKIWAKVLAKEMAEPGSFSFKTLDVLRNMSRNEFMQFDRLASIRSRDMLIKYNNLENLGLSWPTLLRLKEFGLISLDGTQQSIHINATQSTSLMIGTSHLIEIKNKQPSSTSLSIPCYVLTSSALELIPFTSAKCSNYNARRIANALTEYSSKNIYDISLHMIEKINPDNSIQYSSINLLQTPDEIPKINLSELIKRFKDSSKQKDIP
ncbi:MAG: DUF2806 domain-containing protein [Clostridia bacterium]|nr:DUF2806 domain-containing protein [Clostridia bacterium]